MEIAVVLIFAAECVTGPLAEVALPRIFWVAGHFVTRASIKALGNLRAEHLLIRYQNGICIFKQLIIWQLLVVSDWVRLLLLT